MSHLLPVKPFLSLLYGHLGGRKFFYWSLWPKIGTSRVLKARPVDQAINHIYLCVWISLGTEKQSVSKYLAILRALKRKHSNKEH